MSLPKTRHLLCQRHAFCGIRPISSISPEKIKREHRFFSSQSAFFIRISSHSSSLDDLGNDKEWGVGSREEDYLLPTLFITSQLPGEVYDALVSRLQAELLREFVSLPMRAA